MMRHFKMATANRNDETAALTKSNEELRRAYSELEAKYEALAGMYNRATGKGGAAASGARRARAPAAGGERIPQGGAAIPPNKSARSQQWETRNRPSDSNKARLAAKSSLIRTAQTGHEIQADAQDSQD